MDAAARLKLFRGENVDINQFEHSNIVRIFISSTFSDMNVERNILLEKAYPSLRKYCQQLGLDFQVMDMRWGIQDAASIEHSICEICLREIQTCRRLSMGPYFVGFVGNRYGYRPIPSSIGFQNFEKFCAIAENYNIANKNLLKEWYRQDGNIVPSCYILQPITSKYPYFDDNHPKNAKKRNSDRSKWEKDSLQLSDILRKCAQIGLDDNALVKDEAMQFFKSVTELEIEKGISEENSENSIHMYLREITDLKQYLQESSAPKYVDLKQNAIDKEAQDLLEKLKTDIKSNISSSEKVKTYQVNWISEQGINVKSKGHMKYLEKFCQDFIDDMKSSINKSLSKSSQQHDNVEDSVSRDAINASKNSDWLLEEVSHHALFAQKKLETFCGRTLLIEKVMETMLKSDSSYPSIVYGFAGRGKTALIAKIIQCCQERKQTSVIAYRFLGTSPHSSHIQNILQTLILQISEASNLPIPASHLLQNYNDLVQRFSKCVVDASKALRKENKELIIILDSLDQLSPLDGAHRLKWLPKHIPSNVKILLSTLPHSELEIFENLQRSFPTERFIEVTDLDESTGKEILQSWLAKAKRDLTKDQLQLIMNGFRLSSNPLFLKLAFDEALTWHSYTDISTLKMANSTKEAISLYFDRLEKVHSKLFVSRSIGYIIASKNGITEGELEDLLSLDNEILDGSYVYWSPPNNEVVRVPSLLWARLRYDLGDELVERQASGYTVLALYNRLFQEAAIDRYLGEDKRSIIHKALAEYFLGIWSDGKGKPLRLKIWKNKTVNTDRQVASQPYKFSSQVFNMRKLGELSHHLTCAEQWGELNNSVLCNAAWLFHKIQAFSIKDVLEDYDFALRKRYDPEISLIRDAIKQAKPTLEFPGGIRNHLCSELYCRLAFFKTKFPSTVGKLVHESAVILQEAQETSLLPLAGCFQPPGGPLRTTLTGFSKPISSMIKKKNGNILVAGSKDGSIIVWEIGDDEVMYSAKVHEDEVSCLALSGSRLVSGSLDHTLQVTNIETENRVATIEEDHTDFAVHASVLLNEAGNLVISACGSKINVWNIDDLQLEHTFEIHPTITLSCDMLLRNDCCLLAGYNDGSVTCWDIASGEKRYSIASDSDNDSSNAVVSHFARGKNYFLCKNNGKLVVANVESGEVFRKHHLKPGRLTTMSPTGDVLAVSRENNVEVWRIPEKSVQHLGTLRYHYKIITAMKFQESGDILLIGSKDKTITVWNIERKTFEKNSKPLDVIQGMGAPVNFLFSFNDIVASASSKVFYVKLWNRKRNKIVDEPTSFVFDVANNALSPEGEYMVVFNNYNDSITYQDLSLLHTDNRNTIVMSRNDLLSQQKNLASDHFTCLCFVYSSSHVVFGTNSGWIVKSPFFLRTTPELKVCQFLNLGLPENLAEKVIYLSRGTMSEGEHILAVTENVEGSSRFHIVNFSNMTIAKTLSAMDLGIYGRVTAVSFGDSRREEYLLLVGTETCKIYVITVQRSMKENSHSTGKVVQTLTAHEHQITALSLNSDLLYFVSGSFGLTKRLWKFEDKIWKLHKNLYFKSLLNAGVTHAAFTKDGKHVVTGSRERSLKIWKVETGEMVADQYVYATVTGIATTTDERIIATTKLGYVIINKLDHRQSSCGSPMNQITRHESCSKNQVIRREKPQYRSVNDSTTCLLL